MNLLRYVGIRSRVVLVCLLANGAGLLSLLAFVRSAELERVYLYIAVNVVVVGLLAFIVAGSVTGPLMRLRRRLLEVSPKEGVSALGEPAGHDEITALWEALIQWAEGVEEEAVGDEDEGAGALEPVDMPERSSEGLTALLELSRLGHESFDFAHAATAILGKTNAHLGLEWSSVCLVDSDGGALHLVASVGLDRDLSDDLRVEGGRPVQYEPGRGVSGEVIARGEALVINRGHRDKRFARFKDFDDHQQRINSIACFPLKVPLASDGNEGGKSFEVVGVINAFNIKSPPVFRPGDVAFLKAVAEILSVLLGRSGNFETAFLEEISGLYQYGYWLYQFREEAERFKRKPFSIGLIKMALRFSEGLEPTRRNEILREAGVVVRQNFRRVDFACRDGFSFLIALPETDKLGTMFMAGRLKDRCDAMALDPETDEAQFATDMGVAVCPGGATSPDALLPAVDKALEQARMAGDHRLVCYSPPGEMAASRKEEPELRKG